MLMLVLKLASLENISSDGMFPYVASMYRERNTHLVHDLILFYLKILDICTTTINHITILTSGPNANRIKKNFRYVQPLTHNHMY